MARKQRRNTELADTQPAPPEDDGPFSGTVECVCLTRAEGNAIRAHRLELPGDVAKRYLTASSKADLPAMTLAKTDAWLDEIRLSLRKLG